MCILRQVKQGFSGDGKTLSGLIKLEQYGKNLAVEISIINFAPLALGEYYCLITDLKGVCEMLPLRGKSLFNIITDLDVTDGFCAVVCFVKSEITPIAYGVNGKATFHWQSILSAIPFAEPFHSLKNAKAEKTDDVALTKTAQEPLLPAAPPPLPAPDAKINEPPMVEPSEKITLQPSPVYNDESVANTNYYEQGEEANEPDTLTENSRYAPFAGGDKSQNGNGRNNAEKDGDDKGVLDTPATNPDEYYHAIKGELDELFKKYPTDKTLKDAFPFSEWVRVKGDKKRPQCLVGVIYEDLRAKYICYALPAEDKNNPPAEIKEACVFVPLSPFEQEKGFFVIFQSAATGLTIPKS